MDCLFLCPVPYLVQLTLAQGHKEQSGYLGQINLNFIRMNLSGSYQRINRWSPKINLKMFFLSHNVEIK